MTTKPPLSMIDADKRWEIFRQLQDCMYDVPIYTQNSIAGKTTFHDLDLYIREDALPAILHHIDKLYGIVDKTNPNKKTTMLTVKIGDDFSLFEIQTFNSNSEAKFASRYHSFGGIGLLLGYPAYLVHGLKLSDTGLYIRVDTRFDGTRNVLITDQFGEALNLLGFPDSSWASDPLDFDGLTQGDIFRFLESSEVYDPRDWVEGDIPDSIVRAARSRAVIGSWLERQWALIPTVKGDLPQPTPWFLKSTSRGDAVLREIAEIKVYDKAFSEFKTWLNPEYQSAQFKPYDSVSMPYVKRAFRHLLDSLCTTELVYENSKMEHVQAYHRHMIRKIYDKAVILAAKDGVTFNE